MSRSEGDRNSPRAIIHKRILEAAEEQPDASLQALASDIAGASTDLVEQVLEEYGDPTSETDSGGTPDQHTDIERSAPEPTPSDVTPESTPTLESLSEKQRETLRVIRSRLSATQEEVGDMLGVSGAAVSNRLSDVEGFHWEDRAEFIDEVFGARVIGDGHGQGIADGMSELEDRLDELEARLESMEVTGGSSELPPELTHKVVHAVMDSDEFSEEEELRIIEALV